MFQDIAVGDGDGEDPGDEGDEEDAGGEFRTKFDILARLLIAASSRDAHPTDGHGRRSRCTLGGRRRVSYKEITENAA